MMAFSLFDGFMRDAVSISNVVAPLVAAESGPIRGAEILMRALVDNGVDTVFGLPGGAVLHIYDELFPYIFPKNLKLHKLYSCL